MMHCPHCKTSSPNEVNEPKFCFSCGKPMRQPCPYEADSGSDRLISLSDETGRARSACPDCGAMLQSCSRCHRLYPLTANHCETRDCTGTLQESEGVFATNRGAQDGTRSVFAELPATPRPGGLPFRYGERIEVLLWRYGKLIALSDERLMLFDFDPTAGDNAFKLSSSVALHRSGAIPARSVIVDAGRIFVMAKERVLRFSLEGGLHAEADLAEPFLFQATLAGYWAGVKTDSVQFLQLDNGAKKSVALATLAGYVTDLAVFGDTLYLVTSEGQLLSVGANEAQPKPLHTSSTLGFSRVAATAKGIIALGQVRTGTDRSLSYLLRFNKEGQLVGTQQQLLSGSLPDFAVSGEWVYVPRSELGQTMIRQNFLDRYVLSTGQSAAPLPDSFTLNGGEQVEAGLLLVESENGARILVRRSDNASNRLHLFDTTTNREMPVSIRMGIGDLLSEPNALINRSVPFCIAQGQLVYVRREKSESYLHCTPL